MDEILKLMNKYPAPSTLDINKLLEERSVATEHLMEGRQQKLDDDRAKIEELTEKLKSFEAKRTNVSQIIALKSQELDKLKEDLKDLETETNRVLKENEVLAAKCSNRRMKKPNLKDQEILEMGQKKLNLYKELTGIRWDYGVSKDTTKGFVTNKKDYVHAFSFDKTQGSSKVRELVWEEISLSSNGRTSLEDDYEKENATRNT